MFTEIDAVEIVSSTRGSKATARVIGEGSNEPPPMIKAKQNRVREFMVKPELLEGHAGWKVQGRVIPDVDIDEQNEDGEDPAADASGPGSGGKRRRGGGASKGSRKRAKITVNEDSNREEREKAARELASIARDGRDMDEFFGMGMEGGAGDAEGGEGGDGDGEGGAGEGGEDDGGEGEGGEDDGEE
jgi:hypothetical protein